MSVQGNIGTVIGVSGHQSDHLDCTEKHQSAAFLCRAEQNHTK